MPKGKPQHDSYRLRAGVWQIRAIEQGIRPSVRALSDASGVPKTTMYRVVRGRPPNARTIAALVRILDTPFETLFEHIEGES